MDNEIKEYEAILSEDEKTYFAELYRHILALGYKPKKEKKKSISFDFKHRLVKNSIVKFSSEHGQPYLKLKFFATKEYSPCFKEAIRTTIEEFNYKYTGCYRCGKCGFNLEGYTYSYADGRKYFRCGLELIEIKDFLNIDIEETKNLISNQHHFYLSKLKENSGK